VGATRFERATNGLKGHCSTVELRALKKNFIMLTHSRQRSALVQPILFHIQKHPPLTFLNNLITIFEQLMTKSQEVKWQMF
jgi:hypothetical protein